jgi:hypothetical protein
MKRTTVSSALCGVLFLAGCAPEVRTMGVCPPDCEVAITITPGATPCAVARPDPIPVKHPAALRFKLVTPGFHFSPAPGIAVKNDTAQQFHPMPAQSNRTLAVIQDDYKTKGNFPYAIDVDADNGGTHCQVDPIIANG